MESSVTKVAIWGLWFWFLVERLCLHQQVMVIFGALLLIDLVLGTAHAYQKDKQSVTSKAFSRGLMKKLSRLALIIILLLGFQGMGIENIEFIMDVVVWGFILSELYSSIRHIVFFNTKEEMPEMDAFETVLKKVLEVIAPKMELTLKESKKK